MNKSFQIAQVCRGKLSEKLFSIRCYLTPHIYFVSMIRKVFNFLFNNSRKIARGKLLLVSMATTNKKQLRGGKIKFSSWNNFDIYYWQILHVVNTSTKTTLHNLKKIPRGKTIWMSKKVLMLMYQNFSCFL